MIFTSYYVILTHKWTKLMYKSYRWFTCQGAEKQLYHSKCSSAKTKVLSALILKYALHFHSRSDESLPTSSKSIKLESPSLFESPWSDQSGFEAAVAANQKFETPKIAAKMTKPRKIEQDANNAFTLSSDDEEPSPVLVRNPVVQENEPDIRPKRCKGKKYFWVVFL